MLRIRTLLASAAGVTTAGLLSLALSPAPHAAAAGNTYPYGQCTYFAKSQRSDIGNHWGDARFWDTSARAAGFPVDGKPRVGDVVVFERNVQGSSPYGHVGIVTLVQGSRFKTISMWGNEATGKLHSAWHTTGAGVSFIHKRGTATVASAKTTTAKSTKTTAAKAAAKVKARATTAKSTKATSTKAKATVKKATTTKATAKKATATKATAKKTTTTKKVTPVKKVVVTHKKP
jgi:surface antigen